MNANTVHVFLDYCYRNGDNATPAEAARDMQANALLVKSLDGNHPVASILGEITAPTPA